MTMRAQLKWIHSPDIDFETYWPEDEKNFGFLIQAMIGPEGTDEEESYSIQVCTPDWLRSKYSNSDGVFGNGFLIIFEYDIEKIKKKISKYCERCLGENWKDISQKLSRIGHSEFEDYLPYKG